MYQLVDQPIEALAPGSRLALWAVRGWAYARANGGCPPGAIAPAMIHCGAAAALPHLHRLMMLLEGGDSGTLDVLAPDAPTIDDMEAVLVQLWADALARPLQARRTLATVMRREDGSEDEDQATQAFEALASCAARLADCGLSPTGLMVTPGVA